jgi:beta-xylosidase
MSIAPLQASPPLHFSNPVCQEYLADPFCWYSQGTFYAVGTGASEAEGQAPAGLVVPMVKSSDLQHWESVGKILVPPAEERHGSFWAPEVVCRDGTFYLYYQCNGNGKGFHIRVATSQQPEGPYRDVGIPLTDVAKNPFAIDAHAFEDGDGRRYLFYATDFLDSNAHTFRGTALVVDRMKSMTELEGNPQIVMRAHWQWQCFRRDREMYGQKADWYTLEGPAVRKHGDKYYCFYSGGSYENDTYGVDYLVADHVLGPWKEIGRERGPQITCTIPGKVIGPGHCSIVSSPDGERDFIVYHAWDPSMSRRQMWIDPLLWTPAGPAVARFRPETSLPPTS